MMSNKKHVDPIPDEFKSYEEAAEFWDTHDTADYPDAFRTIEVVSEFRSRRFEVEIESDLMKTLRAQARQKGVSVSRLASELLRRQLTASG
jgi:hypothetical protein